MLAVVRMLIVGVMVSGCISQAEVRDWPEAPAEAQSALIALAGSEVAIYATMVRDRQIRPPSFSVTEGASVGLFFFQKSLADLALLEGPLPPVDDPAQILLGSAPFLEAHVAKAGAQLDDWSATARDAVPAPLDEVQIPGEIATCVALGGCFANETAAAAGGCAVPCLHDSPEPPNEPEEPALPALVCPAGFSSEVLSSSASVCRPPARVVCPEDRVQWLNRASCTLVGPPCPGGDYAPDLPTQGTILFVKGDAGSGGDGSRADPFDSLAAAVDIAPPGAVLALAATELVEAPVTIQKPLTLIGACAASTKVHAPILVEQAPVSLERMHLSSDRAAPLQVANGSATLSGVVLSSSSAGGLEVISSSVSGSDLHIRQAHGWAMTVIGEASLQLSNVVVEGSLAYLQANGQSTVQLTDWVASGGSSEEAISLVAAELVVNRALLGPFDGTLLQGKERSSATLTDVVVPDVTPQVAHLLDSALDMERVFVVDSGPVGFEAFGGSELSAHQLVVEGVRNRLWQGDIVVGVQRSTIALDTAYLDVANQLGLHCELDSRCELSDLTIQAAPPLQSSASAIQLSESDASVHRLRVEVTNRTGLMINGPALVEDTVVVVNSTEAADRDAIDIYRSHDKATLKRIRTEHAESAGVRVLWGHALIEDLRTVGGHAGLVIQENDDVQLARALLTDAASYGVCVRDGFTSDLRDVAVARIGGAAEDGSDCWKEIGIDTPVLGTGIAFHDTQSSLQRFSVRQSAVGFVSDTLSKGGRVSIQDGEITDNDIGVELWSPGTLSDALFRVLFQGNKRTLRFGRQRSL